jgi:hypothetical protein
MKTSRLRSNFSRKHAARTQTRLKRHTKKANRFRRRKTRYIMHGVKHRTMRGGSQSPGSMNFKKYNGYNVYDQPIEEISYSTPMQWDD